MSKSPAIMLEALYGDDFEHQALDFLVRVARSYLDLATAEDASVSQRTRDVSAAIELLQIAGEEILHCGDVPLSEPWEYGRMEGRRAAAMIGSMERPEPFDHLMEFDLSLHVGDPHDPLTEPTKPSYGRQKVRLEIRSGIVTNTTQVEFADLPGGLYEAAGVWTARGRLVCAIPLRCHPRHSTGRPLIPEGDTAVFPPGALTLGVL